MTIAASRTEHGMARPVTVRPELARLLAGGPFPDALRAAIKGSGLSLDRIQHRLQLRGVTISVATLSYWQSGRRRPERPESLDALRHLEAVLRVPPNALTALLGPPRPRGRRRHNGRLLPLDVLWGSPNLASLLTRVNASCDGILARISQHDRCEVNADRQLHTVRVSQVLRAEQDGPDRWVLVYDWEVATKDAPQIIGLRNCRLGRIAVDHEAHILVAELLFDRPLATGETLIMEYQVVNPVSDHGNTADSYFRRLRLPVRDYVVEVEFDRENLPLRCQQFSSPAGDVRMARRRNLTVSTSGEVHAVALGVGPGLFGIEWDWPPVIPAPAGERVPPRQAVQTTQPNGLPPTQSANASVHN